MIKLSIEHINAKSPYEVKEAGGGYEFRTEGGILYRITISENGVDTALRVVVDMYLFVTATNILELEMAGHYPIEEETASIQSIFEKKVNDYQAAAEGDE